MADYSNDMISEQAFYKLLRAGLWQKGQPLLDGPLTEDEWKEVRHMAKKQTVEGLVFDGMMMLPEEQQPDCQQRLKWFSKIVKIEQRHRLTNAVLVEAVEVLDREGIKSLLLKGQGIASYYPNPLRRQCGDIDLLVLRKDFEKGVEMLCKMGAQLDSSTARHATLFYDGVVIELHRVATYIPGYQQRKEFVRWSEEVLSESNCTFVPPSESRIISIPTLEFNLIYVFYHIFEHFTISGIGLRQICDLARLLHVNHLKIDLMELEKQLDYYQLLHPWKVFGGLLVNGLGLPQEEFPFYNDGDEKWKKIFEDVMQQGNFGHHSRNTPYHSSYLGRKWDSLQKITSRYMKIMGLFPRMGFETYMWFIVTGISQMTKDITRIK